MRSKNNWILIDYNKLFSVRLSSAITQKKHIALQILAIGAAAWLMRYSTVPVLTFGLAWAVLVSSLIPLWLWISAGSITVPMVELISLCFGVYAGLGAVLQPNNIVIMSVSYEIPWEFVNKALFVSLVGLVTFVVSFVGLDLRMRRRVPVSLDLAIMPQLRVHSVCAAVAVALLIRVSVFAEILPSGGHEQFAQLLLLLSVSLSAVFYYRLKVATATFRTIFVILIVFSSVLGFLSGLLELAIIPLAAVIVIKTSATRRISLLGLGGALAIFLVLNVAKFEFRERVWQNAESKSYLDAAKIWGQAIANLNVASFLGKGQLDTGNSSTWRDSLDRFSLTARLSWVCQNTPSRIPYLLGDSYIPFLYAPVPRLIWSEKPFLSDVLRQIDITYGFVGNDSMTSFGIGYIGEAYANFGILGVVVVMMFQGCVLFIMNTVLNRPTSQGGVAIFVVLLIGMLNGVGSSLIIIYGNLLQMFMCAMLTIFPFTESRLLYRAAPKFAGRHIPQRSR